MTPFERELRARIRAQGPISVEAYMEACNRHYYATRDPIGAAGDFTTAPEIHQMFGELCGACLADCWGRAGQPPGAAYAELGPGRGTLAADALRALRAAGFAGGVHFVEASPTLRAAQAERVPDATWHASIGELPPVPLLLVANEFLDALPVRQFAGGTERRVTLGERGLDFAGDGPVSEDSPARACAVGAVAGHLAAHGGVALFIDYGHERSGPGDTLQAVRGHHFVPALAHPGEQDLTAHVDFQAVMSAARPAGAVATRVVGQGKWLSRLGIAERAEALARAHPRRAQEVDAARRRLCDDGAMGTLFKVIAIHSPRWPAPAGFER